MMRRLISIFGLLGAIGCGSEHGGDRDGGLAGGWSFSWQKSEVEIVTGTMELHGYDSGDLWGWMDMPSGRWNLTGEDNRAGGGEIWLAAFDTGQMQEPWAFSCVAAPDELTCTADVLSVRRGPEQKYRFTATRAP